MAFGGLIVERIQIQGRLQEIQHEIATLRQENNQMRRENNHLNQQLVKVEAERDAYKNDLANLHNELAAANSTIQTLRSSIESLQDIQADNQITINELQSELSGLLSEVAFLESEIMTKDEKIYQAYEQIADLQNSLNLDVEGQASIDDAENVLGIDNGLSKIDKNMSTTSILSVVGVGIFLVLGPILFSQKARAIAPPRSSVQKQHSRKLRPLILRPQQPAERVYRRS